MKNYIKNWGLLIIILNFFIGGYLANHMLKRNNTLSQVSKEVQFNRDNRLETVFSEDNYQKLEELFSYIEDDLVNFVSYVNESNLFNKTLINSVSIMFPQNEQELNLVINRGRSVNNFETLIVYRGELIEKSSSRYLIEFFGNNNEFYSVLKAFSDRGVIEGISILDTQNPISDIEFSIHPSHTMLIIDNNGSPNFFRYMRNQDSPEQFGNLRIRDGWYISISPPMPQSWD